MTEEIKNIWITLEGLDVSNMLACCVKRKGEKWSKQQHLDNIELSRAEELLFMLKKEFERRIN